MDKNKDKITIDLLSEAYPDAVCQLEHEDPFQLLIAVILSAQCTDKRINIITKELYEKVKTPGDFIKLGEVELGKLIQSCGLYKNKSKNIIETCRQLLDKHNSLVPKTMEELTSLPGVGRKTASVVLSNAFDIPAMPVDTHVFRVSNRIGLAKAGDVKKTEKQLMERLPRELWIKAHHLLIFHGRAVCHARNPNCKLCKINKHCDFTNQLYR